MLINTEIGIHLELTDRIATSLLREMSINWTGPVASCKGSKFGTNDHRQ